MPQHRYALFSQPDQRNLEISWSGGTWHIQGNITILFEGTVLHVFEKREELYQPQEVSIPGHPPISICLKSGNFEICQGGKRISNQEALSLHVRIRELYKTLFTYSIFMLIFSLLPLILIPFPEVSRNFPFHPYTILPAIAFALITLVCARTDQFAGKLRLPLTVFSLLGNIILLLIVWPLVSGQSLSLGSILAIGFFIYLSVIALQTWRELYKKENTSETA